MTDESADGVESGEGVENGEVVADVESAVGATRVLGIDFSAAARSCGDNSWVATCRRTPTGLRVDRLATLSETLGLSTSEREPTLAALVDALADPPEPTVVGLDVPFSLPAEFLQSPETEAPALGDDSDDAGGSDAAADTSGNWARFVRETPDSWGRLEDVTDPKSLYERVRDVAETADLPRSRATDEQYGGQEPAGFRIRTQTFYGISALLAPLVEREAVRVPPLHREPDAPVTLLETYPAAVFDALPRGVREGYKGDDRTGVAARERNRAALAAAGVELGRTDASCATATDDALDAVAAAFAASRDAAAAVDGSYTPRERTEGVVFDGYAGETVDD
ncbi:DUF429 domain-containing protein [Halobaculum sp. MBLA0147]|uniref:DUF429 domain-containing protein n=1 Tax=Halobaculum sp. MBLA0147 TaxID=3079934 RepID=UPI003525CEF1